MTAKVISQSVLLCLLTLFASGACVNESNEIPQPRIIPLHSFSQSVEILNGDPRKVGEPFVMRVRELPGNISPPHSHPVDVHLTVLQGTLYFSSGQKFDRATLTELETGGYLFVPKGSMIFSYAPEEAVVQIHGVGPFHTNFADGMKILSEPNDRTAFKFMIGDLVIAKRGKGQIRQGWAFGEVIEYKIEGNDGNLFMAQEEELQRS